MLVRFDHVASVIVNVNPQHDCQMKVFRYYNAEHALSVLRDLELRTSIPIDIVLAIFPKTF